MKFFVPHTTDDKQAEEVFESIRKFAETTTGWEMSSRRIFSLDYMHNSKTYHSEVGKLEREIGEPVIAILESTTYLVCTGSRGVVRGLPILVGMSEAFNVVDFDS